MKHKVKLFSVIMLVSMTACQLANPANLLQQSSPTPTITDVPTAVPTSTPIPEPTSTPTPIPSARLTTAQDLFFAGDLDSAIKEFTNAIDFSNDPEIQAISNAMLGRIYLMQQNDIVALEYFRKAIDLNGSADASAIAHYYLAQMYTALTRYEEAAAEYDAYLQVKPDVLAGYMLEKKGDALTSAGLYQPANEAYSRAISILGGKDIRLDLKVAKNLIAIPDYVNALEHLNFIYNNTSDEYTLAQIDLLVGQIYLTQGETQNAYDRFQHAVDNYPRAYDSYSALASLVNDNQPVNELNRGLINYYVGQYLLAMDVLKQFMEANPVHDGTPHYYRALSLTYENDYEGALSEWDALIKDHPGDRFYSTAWDEKAYTQWYYLDRYPEAAQTLLTFIQENPSDPSAPSLLFEAGRIYERANLLDEAATTWEKLPGEYSGSEYAYMGIYYSGITRYRQQKYPEALTVFQRSLLLAIEPGEKAAAYYWMGKSYLALADKPSAQASWQESLRVDPTGYYSERARDMLTGRGIIKPCEVLDLGYDLQGEKPEAERWMIQQFSLPADTNFSDLSSIRSDSRIQRAEEFWLLGLYSNARDEAELYRNETKNDALTQYKLAGWMLDLGMYRSAILAARQVLSLAGLDDTATLNAPVYFNHIRFGTYFRDLVTGSAVEFDLDPLLIYGVIRQESLFEPFIRSSANAEGLMQMLPSTARDTAAQYDWPVNLTDDDIYRPWIAIRLGSYYLNQQIRLQDGFTSGGLAAYNGGPGNAAAWRELSGDDPDLFLEVVRFLETRNYLKAVFENYNIYRSFYCRQ
jgi:soluble lytic murein transglycosylase